MDIEAFFKIRLKAEHAETKTLVTFPEIHILIEPVSNNYLATCLEYGQSYESSSVSESALGVIDYMYEYFLTVVRDNGREFLYEQAKTCQYDSIWAEIREYSAKKYDADLEYVEASFRRKSNLNELASKIVTRKKNIDDIAEVFPESMSTENTKDKLIAQQNSIIELIKEEYEKLRKRVNNLEEEKNKLKHGLQKKDNWVPSDHIDIVSSSSFAQTH